VATELVFETHALSEDNDAGRATGWLPGRLTATGRANARALGDRRRDDGIDAIFTSDLGRAVETVAIAFEGINVPVLHDWRLRECDYGEWNGGPVEQVHDRATYLDQPYPRGETWREAVARVERAVDDIAAFPRAHRVLVVGHVATRWGIECRCNGASVDALVAADFAWREGWEYRLDG
jgi:broad specificity phosphatase PhoE